MALYLQKQKDQKTVVYISFQNSSAKAVNHIKSCLFLTLFEAFFDALQLYHTVSSAGY